MFRILMLAAMALCSASAHAATWYVLNAGTETTINFFDFDTVAKKGSKVTIWTKYVNKQGYPDTDGSYATATRFVYDCSKRTSQALTASIYDSKGDFIRTFSATGKEQDILPDSVGESILKTVCASNFPHDKSGKNYALVIDNDIYAFAKRWFSSLEAKTNDPAPN